MPPIHGSAAAQRAAAGLRAHSRRMMMTQLATIRPIATAYYITSQRVRKSGWSPSTISRLRGSPGSSNSSDGTWSTVTAK